MRGCGWGNACQSGPVLDQVPLVAERIFENRYLAIGLIARRFEEPDTSRGEAFVIGVEIVGFQEQEHPPASLVVDGGLLRAVGSFGQ